MFKKNLALLVVLFSYVGNAQTYTKVSGQVIDAQTLQPIHGAIVNLQNSPHLSICDSLGNFNLSVPITEKAIVLIKHSGYQSQLIPIQARAKIDLGIILLSRLKLNQSNNNLISLSDEELDFTDDSEAAVIFLRARQDVFQRAAAFNFGPFRFRTRGLDNAYSTVLINGVTLNKFKDNRPEWNNWGGLNDVTRNFSFTVGTSSSDYTFGNILGTHNINTRTSEIQPQTRLSFSNTNAYYRFRSMATHASGLTQNNWSYVVSASKRWAKEGYIESASYDAHSVLVGAEKLINPKHSLNLTSIFAQNTKGRSSYNTEEVTNLTSTRYNSYWGYQDGKKRNSRMKTIFEPIVILSHYWKLTDKTTLQTNLSYQWGTQSSSRLDYNKANNPSPTYYKKLPSYYLNLYEDDLHNPDYQQAEQALSYFGTNPQINWEALYFTNFQNGESVYVLINDTNDDQTTQINAMLNTAITEHINLQGKITFRQLHSENYSEISDLLGGNYFVDTDPYLTGNQAQSNLLNSNALTHEKDKVGYHYSLTAQESEGFLQVQFNYPKWDFYWAQNINNTVYQRIGHFKNGLYPNDSFGESSKIQFLNLSSKVGGIYKYSGKSMFECNGALLNQAPNLKSTFTNPRINNQTLPEQKSTAIISLDFSHHYTTQRLKNRVTAYYSKIANENQVSYYYTEGLGVLKSPDASNYTSPNAFVTQILTGLEKTNWGIECSTTYKISNTINTYAAINWGQYIYSNNPLLILTIDNLQSQQNLGNAYLKNYKQGGMPQQAYSWGIEYRSPKYWWISLNLNYLTNNFVNLSPILRTDNFFVNPEDQSGFPFNDINLDKATTLLNQEKLDDVFSINLLGGKSWRFRKKTIGLFIVVNNILNHTYKIGGYEQSRNANYQEVLQSQTVKPYSFGNNYAYSQGRTYFFNLYIKL